MSELVDRRARERIATEFPTTFVVEAAAGTGKTTMLVARIVGLVASGAARLSAIVAVTFTEKAAGEMKLRLRAEIEGARGKKDATPEVKARLDAALAELEEAHIGTIHGFCADILRAWPIEAGVDPLFEVAAEDDKERLYDEAFDAWFQEVLADPREGVRRVLRRRTREQGAGGPRAALRGAGLSLLEARDFDGAWRRDPFDRELAIDEVVLRLREAGNLAKSAQRDDDYLAQNLAEIQRFIAELDRREAVKGGRDYDGIEPELRELSRRRSFRWTGGSRPYAKGITRDEAIGIRDGAKRALDLALERCEADLAACLRAELAPLVLQYEVLKARAGKLDFLDLLLVTRDLVQKRKDVRVGLAKKISHLLVDEFQDTDPIQADILLMLASDAPEEENPDPSRVRIVPGKIFCVGDPKQSIYRFRRADVALYESLKKRFVEEDGAEVLHLVTSFRSVPSIQRVVNEAFALAMAPRAEAMKSAVKSQADYVALAPFRAEVTTRPTLIALPVPRPYSDWGRVVNWRIEDSLPDAVAAFVDFAVRKSGWTIEGRNGAQIPLEARHVCLLFKRLQNFGEDTTRAYVRALEARSIPHVLLGGRAYHAREEVIAVKSALAAIEWPDDELSVFATLHGPFFALGDDALLAYRDLTKAPDAKEGSLGPLNPLRAGTMRDRLPPLAREVDDALAILRRLHVGRNRRPIADTIAQLLEATRAHAGVAIWPTGEQALANMLRVLDLARRFEARGATSFRAFVLGLEADGERGGTAEAPIVEEGTDGVRIMTVHRAKGLEFPVVVLVDPTAPATMDRPSRYVDPAKKLWAMPLAGCTPIELVDKKEDVLRRDADEAVRLLYVAATRAKEMLVIPAVGDEETPGWVDPLHPVLYPNSAMRRRPAPAPGCPPFGNDTVLERPPKTERGTESAVAPGLHASRVGRHEVVWWDPRALHLDRGHEAGLRQQKLLEADQAGKASEEGARAHAAWSAHRTELLAKGRAPSIVVTTVTELAASARNVTDAANANGAANATAEIDVAFEEVSDVRARPHGRRFGTLVHAVLAEARFGADDAELRALAAKQARLVGATTEETRASEDVVRAALAHPLMQRAASSFRRGECRREVPVTAVLADGALVEGAVDSAFREAGTWVVVDYKTDGAFDAASRTRYEAQVRAYAAAIARATGESARAVLLRV